MTSLIIAVNLIAVILNVTIVCVEGGFSVTSFLIGGNLVTGTLLLARQIGERASL